MMEDLYDGWDWPCSGGSSSRPQRQVGRSVDLVGTSKPTRAQARIATEWGIELSSGFA